MTTRHKMIYEVLKKNSPKELTANEIAEEIMVYYKSEMEAKKLETKANNDSLLKQQLSSEIGRHIPILEKNYHGEIIIIKKPQPIKFIYQPLEKYELNKNQEIDFKNNILNQNHVSTQVYEYDLYPILMNFLNNELNLFCLRINEKVSTNPRGYGGNKWLHPDIVALEPLNDNLSETVKKCIRNTNQSAIKLWSFEVKKRLSISNLRESFFQAVSNSSWANFGYLVATQIENNVTHELQMLSGLHGIGVILLDNQTPENSEIIIPAKEKITIDWQTVNRISNVNSDFMTFIQQVNQYATSEYIIENQWNK